AVAAAERARPSKTAPAAFWMARPGQTRSTLSLAGLRPDATRSTPVQARSTTTGTDRLALQLVAAEVDHPVDPEAVSEVPVALCEVGLAQLRPYVAACAQASEDALG